MTIDVESLYNRKRTNRWERVSVGDIFERLTYSFPNKEAIVAYEGAYAHADYARLTYREADELANQFANGLLAKGLKRADRVLFFCDNSTEAFIAKIGAAKAGMVVAPVNTMMAEDVISYLIDLTEPEFLIADDVHLPVLENILNEKNIQLDVVIPIGGEVEHQRQTFHEFVQAQPATSPEIEIHGDDIWEILFTSGTTSMPKGVMLSHHSTYFAAYNMALSFSRNLKFEGDFKTLSFLPVIYHVADQVLTFSAFLYGGTFVIGRKHEVEGIADAISKEGVTTLWAGAPNFLGNLVDHYEENEAKYDFSSLTTITYGWSVLNPSIHFRLKAICGEDLVLWGLFSQTESVAGFRFWHDEFPETYHKHGGDRNYVGVPSPGLAAQIIDKEGNVIKEPFVPGEVVYRSPVMLSGYYKNEEATKEAVEGEWFHSGDVCMYDEKGLAIMVDRFKDMIKTGGENVYSIRVEAVLKSHDAVENAAVVGIPDDKWGEKVTAFVVLKKERSLSEKDLIKYSREKLAGFETPKQILFVEELPETVGGKILKYKLRETPKEKSTVH